MSTHLEKAEYAAHLAEEHLANAVMPNNISALKAKVYAQLANAYATMAQADRVHVVYEDSL